MVAALLVVALGQFLEDVTLGVGELVLGIPEDEGEIRHGQRWVAAAGKTGTGQHHVHRAQGQALVDVGFLAQAGGREHLDVVPAIGAFLDFLCRPHGVFVEGFGRFIHVRPLEFGLGAGQASGTHCQGGYGAGRYSLESQSFVHRFVSVMGFGIAGVEDLLKQLLRGASSR